MPKTVDEKKAAIIYAFLESNLKPRFQKAIDEVNLYLKDKYKVEIGADLNWLMHELTEEDLKNVKKNQK